MRPDEDPPEEDALTEGEPLPSELPTVDVGNVRAVRKRSRKLSREKQDAAEFWQAVFSSPIGRREMWGILAACHAFEERFACGPNGFAQTEATWFHAGEQSVGQRLYLSWLMQDRAGVLRMQDEFDPRFSRPKQK